MCKQGPGRQLYLAGFILEDLLLFPACTEFLLQLFNGNLHQDMTIDWLGPWALQCQQVSVTDYLGFE